MSEQTQLIFAVVVFLLTYAVIVSDKIHRTIAALIGAGLVAVTKIMSPENAVEAIDFNTIGLLVGMMIIVGITRQTGVFEYLAIKAARRSMGEPLRIMAALSLVTAVLSAFLDNVTTVLLIVPVTFSIASKLAINPLPILISEILASNIGGTATLIGDPPNIMIGSATGLGFMDFVLNLTPIIVIVYILTIYSLCLVYRRKLVSIPELRLKIMEMNERDEIKDPVLLKKCLVILVLTISGFVLHQYLHLESSVIALCGASLLLLIFRKDPEHALQAVEWPVIFFFIGLFVVVGALEKVGVIEMVARFTLDATGGRIVPASMLVLWISAISSAFVDNIPFVATMIPLIQDMGRLGSLGNLDLLWWALSLGACLGGNGTIIGASANVVVIGMAEKNNYHISFVEFMKIAFWLMLMSIIVSMIYLLLWHIYHGFAFMMITLVVGLIIAVILNNGIKSMTKNIPQHPGGPNYSGM